MFKTADDVTPIRAEVTFFAEAMEVQLRANDHKTGWCDLSVPTLLRLLRKEVEELQLAITNREDRNIIGEAADVANFAMMIADNVSRRERP